MSRHDPSPITPLAWRVAVNSIVLMTGAVIIAVLLIAGQGRTIYAALMPDHFDDQWTIRSGRVEDDRLVLRPAAHSIGLALRPIDSPTFTLQTRIAFNQPQGAAGLIVQADDVDHFSAFLISGDGYFRVSDYRNGAWIDRAAWRAWPHIRRSGVANLLRAECQSGTCTFFVNDEWTWQERTLPAPRWIGLAAEAQSVGATFEARFDQLGRQP